MLGVGVVLFIVMLLFMLIMWSNATAEMNRMRSGFFGAPTTITIEP
jgi:hypothetical protein